MPLFETIGLITKTEETDVADAVSAIYQHLLENGFRQEELDRKRSSCWLGASEP